MQILEKNQLVQLLRKHFHDDISSINFLQEGMFSRAYLFYSQGMPYVLKVGSKYEGFLKDDYVWRTFFQLSKKNHRKIPFPEVFDFGEIEGYGPIDGDGRGKFESWSCYLEQVSVDGLDWKDLVGPTFLEQGFVEKTLESVQKLASFVPKTRCFVHGDYGFDNLLIKNHVVSGVLDWAEARYSDPLYDVAWLDFWSEDLPLGKLYSLHKRNRGNEILNFELRMYCYKLHIGLESLLVCAKRDLKKEYHQTKARIASVLFKEALFF